MHAFIQRQQALKVLHSVLQMKILHLRVFTINIWNLKALARHGNTTLHHRWWSMQIDCHFFDETEMTKYFPVILPFLIISVL